jgi:trimethylamine--corrinoid protein Co-methyltransferase
MQGIKNRHQLKVLTDDQVEAIHEASLKILERTGVRIDSEDAAKRLVKKGAAKHPTRKSVLTFPQSMTKDAIKRIPRYSKSYARDPKNDLVFDGEHTFAHCEGGNPNTYDLETGRTRMATYQDLVEFARVMDVLENCNSCGNVVVATDVNPKLIVLKTMEALIKNTSKCVSSYALKIEEADALYRMWCAVAGGEEELRKRPMCSLYGSPSSPLTYDSHVCDVMIRACEHGVPVDLVPCPIAGGTAPLTLAGGLAQQNAEVLAGLMLLQTVEPKSAPMYSGRLSVMDPRTGRNVWGNPEMALASAATVQIAHKYHMVADVYGVTTDAHDWDIQPGLERMLAALVPAMAGADDLSGMGGVWESASSLEMLVIDNEIYADVFRTIRGIEVDEERLALDVIEKVGPMGNFLAQAHTMTFLKKGDIRISTLFDKRSGEKASKEGLKPLQNVAKEVALKILKEHQVTPVENEKDLDRVIKEEEKKLLRLG